MPSLISPCAVITLHWEESHRLHDVQLIDEVQKCVNLLIEAHFQISKGHTYHKHSYFTSLSTHIYGRYQNKQTHIYVHM
jgi:hypothetical protein